MGTICKLQGNGIKNCDEDIRKTWKKKSLSKPQRKWQNPLGLRP
jgi:hypothetical protein